MRRPPGGRPQREVDRWCRQRTPRAPGAGRPSDRTGGDGRPGGGGDEIADEIADEIGRLLDAAADAWREVGGLPGVATLLGAATGSPPACEEPPDTAGRSCGSCGRPVGDGGSPRRSRADPGPADPGPRVDLDCRVCPICVGLRLWRSLVVPASSGPDEQGQHAPSPRADLRGVPVVQHVPVVDGDAEDG